MRRLLRLLRNVAIGLSALALILMIAGILVLRSEWFRNYVREKIVTATEEATGGRVEVGSLDLDWMHLTATVANFVVHGNEPANSPPYLRAARVQVRISLFSSVHHLVQISYLGIERPEANITVSADGRSNVPKPKPAPAPKSRKSPLRTVVDLAVGHFELADGTVRYNAKPQHLDLRGESLRARLWYDDFEQGYKGELSLKPLYVVSGKNTPVKFLITLPVSFDANAIAFQNARIETDQSHLLIHGTLRNLEDPKTFAHVRGQVALTDLKKVGDFQLPFDTRGLPSSVNLDVSGTFAGREIEVAGASVVYGGSSIRASGKLEDPSGSGSMQFEAQVALAELGRLLKLDMRPEGTLQANGSARMDAKHSYDVQAFVDTKGLSIQQGSQRIRDIALVTEAHLTPHQLDLRGLRLSAFGAELAGEATLEDFARYSVNATLSHFDLHTFVSGYSGSVSGPLAATGDLRTPGIKSLVANARLSIAPGKRGIPISGHVAAEYRGDSENLTVSDSTLALPHSRLRAHGSIGSHLSVELTTSDLGDFKPLTKSTLPVTLNSNAAFAGTVTGKLTNPQIAGHLAVARFAAEGRDFDGLSGDVAASSSRVALTGGNIRRGNMQAQLNGSLGLQNWSPTQNQPLAVQAFVHDGDLADVLALTGNSPVGYSGALTADVNISGTLGNPRGAANISVTNGTLDGEPIDRAQAQVTMEDQLVTVTNAEIAAGPSHVDLTAEFHHPRDRFDRGDIHAHLASSSVDLSKLRSVQNLRPNSGGTLQFTADVTGQLANTFTLTNVAADATGGGLRVDGQNLGNFTAAARTNGQAVTYNVSSDFAGSQIHVTGNTNLAAGYQTTADATIAALPVERVLAVLRRTDIPAKGILTATAHVSGTLDHPEGNLDATVERGAYAGEAIDRVHARVTYLATSIDVPQLEVRAGSSGLDASARYDHAAGLLTAGELQFHVSNGHLDLARVKHVQDARPGLTGTVQLTAAGSASIGKGGAQVLPHELTLNLTGKGLADQGKNLGDLTLAANTTAGRTNFTLDSNLAGAFIQGKGSTILSGDYPLSAQLSIRNITYKGLQPLLGPVSSGATDLDAAADGDITVSGPLMRTEAMTAHVQLSRLWLTATTPGLHVHTVSVQNQGPIAFGISQGVARIESLHLIGPQTDVQAQGTVTLATQALQVSLSARSDLSLLEEFNRDLISSGKITADATLRGTLANPVINGKLQLASASVNFPDVITGLSNANGTVDFNGTSAQFRDLTGEVGGGKVTLSGFMAFSGAARMALRLNGKNVRIRLQPGVSALADADVHLSGRTDQSIASGTVTINQITYNPKSDLGALLARAAPSVPSLPTPSVILDNMKLDVQVRSSSSMAVRASVAQSLQADVNLHIQGTAAQPGILGRVAITEGKLVFMSSTFTVNTGTISFFNPIRIDPILDLSLQTRAQGVDVTVKLSGPIDNMKLSYTSNPPLQFQEVIGLLAAGQTPTSDPNILANQPTQPPQNFQAMGESMVIGQALADPVANQMQRVFGLSQFKIDPAFYNGQDLPQAQLSLQQQVTSRVTLTYSVPVGGYAYGGQQAVSGQYVITREWSASAIRDQWGLLTIKLMYRRQFK